MRKFSRLEMDLLEKVVKMRKIFSTEGGLVERLLNLRNCSQVVRNFSSREIILD
jgi:hypothetical protein